MDEKQKELIELWTASIEQMLESTRQRMRAYMKFHGLQHASNFIASGIGDAQHLASSYQTVKVTDMVPSGIMYNLIKHYLEQDDCILVTGAWSMVDFMESKGPKFLDSTRHMANVFNGDTNIQYDTVKTIVIHEDTVAQGMDKSLPGDTVYHLYNHLFPTKALNTTHIDIIHIR